MMRHVGFASALALCLLASIRARAAELAGSSVATESSPRVIWTNPEPPSSEPFDWEPAETRAPAANEQSVPTYRHWYGGQLLVADAVSVVALIVPPLGLTGYLLVAPSVHSSHGHGGKALASVGLRVGMPVGGGLLGLAGGSGGNDPYPIVIGIAAGMLGAIIVDDAVIANEDVPVKETATSRLSVRANAIVCGHTVGAGLVGVF